MFADVVLPLKLNQAYTFSIPDQMRNDIQVGCRVMVAFGSHKMYSAIVYKIHNNRPKVKTLKEIVELIDREPIVTKEQIKLWEWIAWYYACSLGQVMIAALPSRLRIESDSSLSLNNEVDFDVELLNEREKEVITYLSNNNKVRLKDLEAFLGLRNAMPIVQSLIEKELIQSEESYNVQPTRKPVVLSLNAVYNDELELKKVIEHLEKRAPKQFEALLLFFQLQNDLNAKMVDRSRLLEKKDVNSAVVNALIKKEILISFEVDYIPGEIKKNIEARSLLPFQKQALEQIREIFKTDQTPVLLHGVTSSGKTEIIKHLINDCIQQGKQVLYLLPEIALTTQMIQRFERVYGQNLLVYHSKYSDRDRSVIYHRVLNFGRQENINNDPFQIIIGARSSLFLPFAQLGLIIIDEEHDQSYKQQDPAPRYHARDVAVVLAAHHQCHIVLASATPAIESIYNVQKEKYKLIQLSERYGGVQLPELCIVDMLEERNKGKLKGYFSSVLMDEIQTALGADEQIILFQNRRGYSSFIQCETCQYIPQCANCDVTLTLHKYYNKLMCHYCGFSESLPEHCPECKQSKLLTKGFGTERIEDELSIHFPKINIARLDFDTAKTKTAYQNILSSFEKKQAQVLIGTQMVTKGFDFSNVSLVGILNADLLLNFPDFRSAERSYQMLEQVGGRAGRRVKRGKVILQTYNTEHPVIELVKDHNYDGFIEYELEERKQFFYPPFSRLIEIYLRHRKSDHVQSASRLLFSLLKSEFGKEVYGPVLPEVSRIKNQYLRKILVKIPEHMSPHVVRNKLSNAMKQFDQNQKFHNVQLHLDVDPY
ncbi:MAG TPA: primosomal protein N' [Bacteroidia bacterium]|nr:primosomal protein N' [Bacteroidia bacterium]HNT81121.1 primosomal protein N' [Bacteroidia bacterium]